MIARPIGEMLLALLLFQSAEGTGFFTRPSEKNPRNPQVASGLVGSAFAKTFRLPVAADRDAWPRLRDEASLGVDVAAESAIVVDREYGKVLFEKNADMIRPVASLTKLMTVLVALDAGIESKKMIFSERELSVTGSNSFRPGDTVTGRDLVLASLVASANEAAAALVTISGLDEKIFVDRMNGKARALGMARTRFVDPTGLDGGNVGTARDMVRLLEASRQYPLVREGVAASLVTIAVGEEKKRTLRTTDLLLQSFLARKPYHIAVAKTGSLEEAGFCLAASVDQDSHGVLAVVLGSDTHFSRFEDMKVLVYWAFSRFEWPNKPEL